VEFICCKGSDGSLSVPDAGVIARYELETLRTQRGVQNSYVAYHCNAYKLRLLFKVSNKRCVMAFLTGLKLAAAMAAARMANTIGGLSIHSTAFRGVYRKSSLRNRSTNKYSTPGSGQQECFRRRNGGFYDVRKRSMFP
jgi:hypothetical protein